MDCERARWALAAESPPPPAVVLHLESCSSCALDLERLRSAMSILEASLALDEVTDFSAQVRKSVSEIERSGRAGLRPLVAAAAVLVGLVVAWVASKDSSPTVESPAMPHYERTVDAPPAAPEPEPSPSPPPVRSTAVTPEVVVPPGQDELILLLQRRLAEGRISLAPSSAERREIRVERLRVTRLRIEPLEIE